MTDDKLCSGCPERNTCSSTYEQLGKFRGPSVVFKSVGAFLVPILLFAISLGLFERVFEGSISDKNTRTVICTILGLIICSIYLLMVRLFYRFSKLKGTSKKIV